MRFRSLRFLRGHARLLIILGVLLVLGGIGVGVFWSLGLDRAGAAGVPIDTDNYAFESLECVPDPVVTSSVAECRGVLPETLEPPVEGNTMFLGLVSGSLSSCNFTSSSEFDCPGISTPATAASATNVLVQFDTDPEQTTDYTVEVVEPFVYETTLDLTEGGDARSLSVTLQSDPGPGGVELRISSLDRQALVEGQESYSLFFNSGNWTLPQTAAVLATDDLVPGDNEGARLDFETIAVSAPAFHDLTLSGVALNIEDNDTPGFEVSATSLDLFENNSSRLLGVRLTTPVAAGEVVNLRAASDSTKTTLTTLGSSLNYNDSNWSAYQYIRVSTVDNGLVWSGTDEVVLEIDPATTTDPAYQDYTDTATVGLNLIDNDRAGLDVSDENVILVEGQSGLYIHAYPTSDLQPGETITLQAQSTNGNVELSLDGGTYAEVQSYPYTAEEFANLEFVPVYLRAVDDTDAEAIQTGGVEFSVLESSEPTSPYAAALPTRTVEVSILDDDSPSLELDEQVTGISEGNTITWEVRTNTPITGSDVVEITLDFDPAQITVAGSSVSPYTVVLDAANSTQEVSITALDDTQVEAADIFNRYFVPVTFGYGTGTTAPGYTLGDTATTALFVHENDNPELVISNLRDTDGNVLSGSPVPVLEGTTSVEMDVTLGTQPSAPVFTGALQEGAFAVSPSLPNGANLRFDETNWNQPQTLRLDLLDDENARGDTLAQVVLSSENTFTPFNYRTFSEPVVFAVDDNDTPGIIIESLDTQEEVDNDLRVGENGPGDTLRYRLASQPLNPVTITARSVQDQLTLDNAPTQTIVLDATNWQTGQTLTVQAVDDAIDRGTEYNASFYHTVSSPDTNYARLRPPGQVATVSDDDVARVEVVSFDAANTAPDGENVLSEDSLDPDYLQVRLTTRPQNLVTLTATVDPAQLLFSGSETRAVELEFNAANWNQPQSLAVTAVDDSVVETDPHSSDVTFAVQSGDANYNNQSVPAQTFTITENDSTGLLFTPGSLTVAEDSSTASTFTVAPTQAPAPGREVKIDITGVDPSLFALSPTTHVFASEDPVTVTVTVTPIDNEYDQENSVSLTVSVDDAHPNADPVFAGYSTGYTVTVTDDDEAGLLLTPSVTNTSEDTADASILELSTLSRPLPGEEITVVVAEAGTGSGQVTLSVDGANFESPGEGVELRLSEANYSQTPVYVRVLDDGVSEGDHAALITATVAASSVPGSEYGADTTSNTATIQIADNDTPGFTLTPNTLQFSENGGTGSFDVVLNTSPEAGESVTLELRNLDETLLEADVTAYTFTSLDWDEPETFALRGLDNDIVGDTATTLEVGVGSESDPDYLGLSPKSVSVTLESDDTPEVVLENVRDGADNPLSGSVIVSENGGVLKYDLRLTKRPKSNVYFWLKDDLLGEDFTITPSRQEASGTGCSGNNCPYNLVFTPADYATAQTITLTAIDNAVDTPNRLFTLEHTNDIPATDAAFRPLATTLEVTLEDDDTRGITARQMNATNSSEDAENGVSESTDTPRFDYLRYRLESAPQGTVTLRATADGELWLGTEQQSEQELTFDASNWNLEQSLPVQARDDRRAEGEHVGSVSFEVLGMDADYAALAVPDQIFTILDNDTVGLEVTPGLLAVPENGGTGTFDVRLTSEPSSVVSLEASLSNAGVNGTLDRSGLEFGPDNWNTYQTITVTGVDDRFDRDDVGSVQLSANTQNPARDQAYDGVVGSPVTVSFTNDDTAALLTSPTVLNVNEDQSNPQSTLVSLGASPQPGERVRVTMSPANGGDEVRLRLAGEEEYLPAGEALELSFDSGNFEGQTVEVQAADDNDLENAHTQILNTVVTQVELGPDQTGSTFAATPALAAPDITVNIADNEGASIVLNDGGDGTTVSEATAFPDSLTLALSSNPTGPVTAQVSFDDSQIRVNGQLSPVILNFVSTVPRPLVVTAVDDARVEADPHATTLSVLLSDTSPDGFYNGLSASASIDILDNDVPGLRIENFDSATGISENGGAETFEVALTREPQEAVYLYVDAGSELTVTPALQTRTAEPCAPDGLNCQYHLAFTSENWNQLQTVSLTALDNSVDAPDLTVDVRFSTILPATDARYRIATPNGAYPLTILDDDTRGVRVIETDAATRTVEGGAGDTVRVGLESEPTDPVTVTLSSNGELTFGIEKLSTRTLTINPEDWSREVEVLINAFDDFYAEGEHAGTVAWQVDSADANYQDLVVTPLEVAITDNDFPRVLTSESTYTIAVENGGQVQIPVFLATRPRPDQTVNVIVEEAFGGNVRITSEALTFDENNWNTPIPLTLEAIPDDIDRDDVETLRLQAGGGYSEEVTSVQVAITNDDTAGIAFDPAQITLNEVNSGRGQYTLGLTSEPQPGEVVTLTLAEDNSTPQITLSLNELLYTDPGGALEVSFDASNWTGVPVYIRAIDDTAEESFHETFLPVTSVRTNQATSAYGTKEFNPEPLRIGIIDDESASFSASRYALSLDEAEGTGSFSVVLTQEPVSPVTITVTPEKTGEVLVDRTELVFTRANYALPQSVTLTGVDDEAVRTDTDTIVLAVAPGSDPTYAAMKLQNIDVTLVNDDVGGLEVTDISPLSKEISENGGGSTGVYTAKVRLTREPSAAVYVWAGAAVPGRYQIQPETKSQSIGGCNPNGLNCRYQLVFTPQNWQQFQTLSWLALDNSVAEGNYQVNYRLTTNLPLSPANYRLGDVERSFVILDDDRVALRVENTNGSTQVSEAGAVDEVRVALGTQPQGTVTVRASADGELVIGGVRGGSQSLQFDAGNWNQAQSLIVQAHDDTRIEGNHTGRLSFALTASNDERYNALEFPDFTVGISDNETASFAPDKFNVAVDENNGQAQVGISLGAEPNTDVVVDVTTADSNLITLNPQTITITPDTWNDPTLNTFLISGVNNNSLQDNSATVRLNIAEESDASFVGLPEQVVAVEIINDDTVGVVVTETGGSTIAAEGSTGLDSYRLRLSARPQEPVTVRITSDDQIYFDGQDPATPRELTFTPETWNQPQVVNVSAIDDTLQEGLHAGVLTHQIITTDPDFATLGIDDIAVSITDNETPGLILTSNDNSTSESGDIANVYFTLTSRPSTRVSVPVLLDDASEASLRGVSQIDIEPENWNNPSSNFVVVSGEDDDFDDGDVSYTLLTGTPVSSDEAYAALGDADTPDYTLLNEDDDTAGITVKVLDGITSEDGSSAEFSLQLNSKPTGPVTVELQSSAPDEGTIQDKLVIQPEEWVAPQTVTVTGIDDDSNDDNQEYTIITSEVTSPDPTYEALTGTDVEDVKLTNEDNEDTQIIVSSTAQVVSEDGGSATASFRLSKRPAKGAEVVIPLSIEGGEGDIQPVQLTLKTPFGTLQANALGNYDLVIQNENWDKPAANSVEIVGLNDPYIDGDATFRLITGTTQSLDPEFDRIPGSEIANLTFTNTDNDLDSDGDCSTNEQEVLDGTDPRNSRSYRDSDGDEVPDGQELFEGTNPNDNGDYLDTDSDGTPDCVEKREGTDPRDPNSFLDADQDGFSSFQERRAGTEAPLEIDQGTGVTSGGSTVTPRTGGLLLFVPLGIITGVVGFFVYKLIRRKYYGQR